MTTDSITKDDFIAWKNDPVTKEVFNLIREHRKQSIDYLLKAPLGSDKNILLEIGEQRGVVSAFDTLLEIEFE